MDLHRMLDTCHRHQWSADDLDWSAKPRPLTREQETTIVQYFTDMAGIERLAKALFEVQRRLARDPVLKEIFSTFVIDEERHAVVAERLAAHYDVHRYREYRKSRSLEAFAPHFLDAIRYVTADVANMYITAGELLLDVALLRSIDDFVADDMSRQAMHLINRDESRHIAIDYYMVEYYASPEYRACLRAQPRLPLSHYIKGTRALVRVLYHARPFLKSVFLEPMAACDPSGRRLREAFKRIQLLGNRPDVSPRPFARYMQALQAAYQNRGVRMVAGPVLTRLAGVPGKYLENLYSPEEAQRAAEMSYEDLAAEALAAKHLH
jgi:hypothetical protein